MSIQRWLLSLFTFFLLGALVVNGQKPMTGFISATYPDGSPFGNGIYFTAYDSGRQLIHGLGLYGQIYTFDSNTLVLQNTTSLRLYSNSSFVFSNLNIPVGINIRTGSSHRLIATYTVTTSGANVVHTVMLDPRTMTLIAFISGASPTQLIPTTNDRTTFDPVNGYHIHILQVATNLIRYYIFRINTDNFVATRVASDPYGVSLSILGNKPTVIGEVKPYYDGKKFVTFEFYPLDGANIVGQYVKDNFGTDIQNQISSNTLISLTTVGRQLSNPNYSIPPGFTPSPTSTQLFGATSEDLLYVRSFTLGSSGSSYILFLSYTIPSKGNFIVQMAASDVAEGNTAITPKSVTQFATQTTFTQIAVDEDAYPGNSTRVFFLTTSTGRVFKYRFRDSGGVLDIESTPVTTENIVGGGISFTDQIFLPSEKRLFVSSNADVPNDLSKLYIVPFADCGSKTTCSSCIAMNDPYCGWCVLDGKCSYNSTCSSSGLTNGWLKTPGTNQCPSVSNFVASQNPISVAKSATYQLTATTIPTASYTCRFTRENGATINVTASLSLPNVTCTLPASITGNLYHGTYENLSLSLIYTTNNIVFATFSNVITIYDCGNITTCSGCQSLSYSCGWCVLDGKCTTSASCSYITTPGGSFQWLASGSNNCPTAVSASPSFIDVIAPIPENRKVTLSVNYMPTKIPALSAMTCNYLRSNGTIYSIDVSNYNSFVLSGNTLPVDCPIPLDYDQHLFTSGDREPVTISLSFSNNGKTIVSDSTSTRFYFSSCATKTTCESCTSQDFPCVWATDINACDSPNGPTTLPYSITSSAKCPSIVSSPFVYIAENTSEGIQIEGKNLPEKNNDLLYRNGVYTCVFSNGFNTTGNRASDTLLICPSPLVSVDNGLSSNVTVSIVYGNPSIQGNNYTLPQSSTVAVAYFDCNYYGESCLTCREASNILSSKCGWCKSGTGKSYCSTQSNCTNNNDWSFSDCPAPTITSISPTSGPIDGGTLIVITGQNLGLNAQAIDYVQIGTIGFCREITWVNTNTIKCLTNSIGYPDNGKIVVSISGVTYTSPQNFNYVIPTLNSITPGKGPVAGGTLVVIGGNYTNVGSNFKIDFGGLECRNLTIGPSQISCLTPFIDEESGKVVNITVTIDDAVLSIPFTYTPNPKVESISPRFSHASGKANMTITGTNLDLVENPVVRIGGVVAKIINSKKRSSNSIVVEIPDITESIKPDDPITVSLQIAFGTYILNSDLNFIVYANPTITEFSPTLMYTDDIQEVFIVGTDLLRGGTPKITISGVDCVPNNRSKNSLVKCDLDKSNLTPGVGKISMQINAINISSTDDFTLSAPPQKSNKLVGPIVGGLAGLFLLLLLIGVIIYWYKMKRNKKKTQMLFAELDQANEQNMKVLSEVMEAYTEYNTRDKTFSNPLFGAAAISFTSFESYAVETLFPKDESVSPPAIIGFSSKSREFKLITDFKQLLLNENFTSVFLKTMEKQSDFKVIDRKYTAAILMISLHSNMDYATKLLFHLMKEYIQDKVKSGESKTILRATSTITEKYLTAWLAFSLFSFIQEHLSKQLLNTYASIKGQIEKGAVDYLTGSSQYTINASSILRQKVNYERIKIKIGYLDKSPIEIEVNTCDCISQVINSALFVFEGNTKNAANVGLFNSTGKSLQDIDTTNEVDGEWTKYNTLEHYQIKNGDELKLMKKADEKPTESTAKYYHLEKKVEGATEQKVAPSEVFFTRMMTMREVIHQHVDSLFESVFSTKEAPPVPVKLLFDFLDQSARDLGVNDPDTIHIWKNNSLALRFWVNLITNPNQLFDITKTVPVHNSLSTVGQVLMDSCSTSDLKLGQGAPASKLLYKNEVEEYKKLVSKYYEYVRQAHLPSNPTIPVPPAGGEKLDENSALYELRKYANKYSEQIKEALSGDLKSQFEENMK